MKIGKIVLLNGTSSSGKSTIAQALQELMLEPYLHTGIDHFLERLPKRYFVYSDGSAAPVEGWLLTFQNERFIRAELGPLAVQLLGSMYQGAAGFALGGANVILDDVIYDPRVLRHAVSALAPLPAYFIGVCCPIEVAEQREIARGNRAPGGARFFGELVHQGLTPEAPLEYDLEVDSAHYSAIDCAQAIKTFLQSDPEPAAFRRLSNHL